METVKIAKKIPLDVQLLWGTLQANGNFNLPAAQKVINFEPSQINGIDTETQSIQAMHIPNLGAISKYDPKTATVVLVQQIVFYQSLVHVTKLTDQQIEFVVEIILTDENYKLLTLADTKIAIKNGFKQKYGQLFGRFDLEILCGWLNAYIEEKDAARAVIAERIQSQNKPEEVQVYAPEIREAFTGLLDKIVANDIAKKEKVFNDNEADRKAERERLEAKFKSDIAKLEERGYLTEKPE